jgi:Flp pilus assembly protein TadD
MARARRPKEDLARIGLAFDVAVAQAHADCHPDDLDALRALAYAYTACGRLEEALAADRRLVEAAPDRPDLRYDLACSLALLDRRDEAFEELGRAVDLGFLDREQLLEDPDLVNLRRDGRWPDLLSRVPEDADGEGPASE